MSTEPSNRDSFDLLYPGLPPDGSFTLIFSSVGPGILEKEINISDQNGLCKQALSEDKSSLFVIIISVLGVILYIAIIFYFIGSTFLDFWKSKLIYKDYHVIVSKKRPFYISNESWNDAIKEALNKKIYDDHYVYPASDVQKSLCYKILCSEKPQLLDEHIWTNLLEKCNIELESSFVRTIDSLLGDSILELLNIEKPQHFQRDKWEKIQGKLSKNYITYKMQYYFLQSQIETEIKKSKPEKIREEDWQEYSKHLKEKYKRLVQENIYLEKDPLAYIEKIASNSIFQDDPWVDGLKKTAYKLKLTEIIANFQYERDPLAYIEKIASDSIFQDDQLVDGLKKIAYKLKLAELIKNINYVSSEDFIKAEKPHWMLAQDYERIKDEASMAMKKYKFKSLFDLLNLIFSKQILPLEKPDCLSSREWSVILEIEQRIKIDS